MTRLFVGSCFVVFFWSALDAGILNVFAREGGIESLLLGGPTQWEKVRWGALSVRLVSTEPWRLLSATYVHFGLLHVGFNMLAIVSLGKALEPQLGPARYVVTLIGTAVIGFIASHLWYTEFSAFRGLTAGSHLLTVTGTVHSTPLHAEAAFTVAQGRTEEVSLTLA